jgi:hypothetical protein
MKTCEEFYMKTKTRLDRKCKSCVKAAIAARKKGDKEGIEKFKAKSQAVPRKFRETLLRLDNGLSVKFKSICSVLPGYKRCGSCKLILATKDFGKHLKADDGFYIWCKRCTSVNYKRGYTHGKIERIKEHRAKVEVMERSKKYMKVYRKEVLAAKRKEDRDALGSDYLKGLIKTRLKRKGIVFSYGDIPLALIEATRIQISNTRLNKELSK